MIPATPLILLAALAFPPLEDGPSAWSDRFHAWCAAAGLPSAQAAVLEDGEVVWTDAVGPPGEDVTYPAASLGKPVLACVVLALAEEDGGEDAPRLDLDAPIASLFPPEHRRTLPDDPRFEGVTPRRILSHSAGLAPGGRPTLVLDPGERFGFSGAGFDLLQRAVEARTGEPLEVLAARYVFEPAGMTRSTFVAGTRVPVEGAPVGHDRFGEQLPFRDPPRASASYSLRTTAGDYARFLSALAKGDLLSDASRALLFTPAIPADRRVVADPDAPAEPVEGVAWGLGFGLEETPDGTVAFVWGNLPGFRTYAAFAPAEGDGAVWLAASADGLALRDALVGAVLPGPHPAHAWLEVERHDDPSIGLSRRLGIAARDDGVEAAKALFAEWLEDEALAPLLAAEERLVGETGQLLQLSGRSKAAAALLEWNAELAPDDQWAHENLARVLLFIGRHDDAAAALRRCLELDPTNRFAFETLRRLDSR